MIRFYGCGHADLLYEAGVLQVLFSLCILAVEVPPAVLVVITSGLCRVILRKHRR